MTIGLAHQSVTAGDRDQLGGAEMVGRIVGNLLIDESPIPVDQRRAGQLATAGALRRAALHVTACQRTK